MEAALAELPSLDPGFPPGDNFLAAPASADELAALANEAGLEAGAPLAAFYRTCREASLPDVHNGYFIVAPPRLLKWHRGEAPTRVTGARPRDILPFGADGGGAYFALDAGGQSEVIRLADVAVRDRVADGDSGEVTVVAADFPSFLERLLADVEAFIGGVPGWTFIDGARS